MVSRDPSAEGGFALALTTLPVQFDPLAQPLARNTFLLFTIFIGRAATEPGSWHLHNGVLFVPITSVSSI